MESFYSAQIHPHSLYLLQLSASPHLLCAASEFGGADQN
jgi:hypothetical protein